MEAINILNPAGYEKRNFTHASEPGSYQMALVLNNTKANPGGEIEGEIFISGYGQITDAKIMMYTPPQLFNSEESFFHTGFDLKMRGNVAEISQGGKETKGFADAQQIGLSTLVRLTRDNRATELDMFSDADSRMHMVFSEARKPRAPVSFSLKLRKKIATGSFPLSIVFTYFNGEQWCTQLIEKDITIRNLVDRLDWRAALFLLFAAFISTAGDFENARTNITKLGSWIWDTSFPHK